MSKNRKTKEEIETEIIRLCWGFPRSPQAIAKLINSNWLTIKWVINSLLEDKVLEEITVDYKPVGYKVRQIIKNIVINSFSPRDFNYDFPNKWNDMQLKKNKPRELKSKLKEKI